MINREPFLTVGLLTLWEVIVANKKGHAAPCPFLTERVTFVRAACEEASSFFQARRSLCSSY
jgi:hypothetical protein